MSRDRFRLPEGIASTGDPVDGNPFPPEDPRHEVWNEATRVAETETAAVSQRALDRSTSFADFLENPIPPYEWLVLPVIEKFDVWAKRGVHVIWSDDAVSAFDRWLVSYANGWLKELADFLERKPPPFSAEEVLTRAANALGARVQYWKGEVRRYREQQRAAETADPTHATPEIGPELKKRRRLIVARVRRSRDLTAEGFARRVGISESAVRGIVNEDRKRFSDATQRKLLDALSVSHEEWYRT